MMAQHHAVPTSSVPKVIPLCALAPFAVLSCGYMVLLFGSPMGALALSLFGLGMLAANLLRAWSQWYNARHPDETAR